VNSTWRGHDLAKPPVKTLGGGLTLTLTDGLCGLGGGLTGLGGGSGLGLKL
jgi:hypothetical protein